MLALGAALVGAAIAADRVSRSALGDASVWTPKGGSSSAATSVNARSVPALFRRVRWRPGTVNVDIGAGRYDTASRFLRSRGVENVPWDPFNRSAPDNKRAVQRVHGGRADTATVANVLNVLPSKASRERVIQQAADAVGSDGTAYFAVYEGDGSCRGRRTTKGWQANCSARSFVPEIQRRFPRVRTKGNVIIARKGPGPLEGFVAKHGRQWCVHNEPTRRVIRTKRGPRCYPSKRQAEQVWYRLDCHYTGRHCDKVR